MRDEAEYEDLLANWANLELGLGVILTHPQRVQEFLARVHQYDRWMQSLLDREPDLGLYQLFQLASNSPVGYSASHALICAALCHLIAKDMAIGATERNSLVHAALTMNIAMTRLQDELSVQKEKPSQPQQEVIRTHSIKGAMMLGALGVQDESWLDIVAHHHDGEAAAKSAGDAQGTAPHVGILKAVDRYAAMISPRHTRAGRSALDSIKSIFGFSATATSDPVGDALVRSVGLYPPGTYVALSTAELAVVVRRSPRPNQPFLVLLSTPQGEMLTTPRLHDPAASGTQIRASLAAAQVDLHINHAHILRLAAYAARLR